MKRYQPKTPRAAFAVAAFAMTTLSMSAFVAAPGQFGTANPVAGPALTPAAVKRVAPVAQQVTIHPSSIEVVAYRIADLRNVQARNSTPLKRKG